MTDSEKQYYNECNKCCGTCRWHCQNPYYDILDIRKKLGPWLCGCPESYNYFGHSRPENYGKRCTHWEARNPSTWRTTCSMLRQHIVNTRGKKEWINLEVVSNDILEYFDKLVNAGVDVQEAVRKTGREFKIKSKDVLIAKDFAKHSKEVRQ